MTKDELRVLIRDLLIDNIVYSSYYDYYGNATSEIDYDKTADGIVNDLEKEQVLFEVDA